MDKTNVFFPGYARCVTCQELISDRDAREHILNCRPKLSNEKRICSFCNQLFDTKILKQHMETCQQSQNSQSNALDDNDNENDAGFQTPRALTPTQVFNYSILSQFKSLLIDRRNYSQM